MHAIVFGLFVWTICCQITWPLCEGFDTLVRKRYVFLWFLFVVFCVSCLPNFAWLGLLHLCICMHARKLWFFCHCNSVMYHIKNNFVLKLLCLYIKCVCCMCILGLRHLCFMHVSSFITGQSVNTVIIGQCSACVTDINQSISQSVIADNSKQSISHDDCINSSSPLDDRTWNDPATDVAANYSTTPRRRPLLSFFPAPNMTYEGAPKGRGQVENFRAFGISLGFLPGLWFRASLCGDVRLL